MELFGSGEKREGEGLLDEHMDPDTIQHDFDPDLMEYEVGERVMWHSHPGELGLAAVVEAVDGDDFYTIKLDDLNITERRILNTNLVPIGGSGHLKSVPEQRGREQASAVDPQILMEMAKSMFGKSLEELTYEEYHNLLNSVAAADKDNLKRTAADESQRIIVQKIIEEQRNPRDTNSYFIEGSAVDKELGDGFIACQLEERSGGHARVTVADGPFTGTEYTVPEKHLKVIKQSEYDSVSEDLFK